MMVFLCMFLVQMNCTNFADVRPTSIYICCIECRKSLNVYIQRQSYRMCTFNGLVIECVHSIAQLWNVYIQWVKLLNVYIQQHKPLNVEIILDDDLY